MIILHPNDDFYVPLSCGFNGLIIWGKTENADTHNLTAKANSSLNHYNNFNATPGNHGVSCANTFFSLKHRVGLQQRGAQSPQLRFALFGQNIFCFTVTSPGRRNDESKLKEDKQSGVSEHFVQKTPGN